MRARRIRAQLEWWQTRSDVDEDVRKEAKRLGTELTAIEEIFTNPKQLHDTDRLKMRGGLDGKLADLPHAIAGADAPPTRQARDVFEKHETRVNEVCARLDDLVTTDLAQFDERIRALGVPLIDAHRDASSAAVIVAATVVRNSKRPVLPRAPSAEPLASARRPRTACP